jgi:hypothetical protein
MKSKKKQQTNPLARMNGGFHGTHIEPSLKSLWSDKYEFNRSVLGLNEETAKEWANRTIRAILATEVDFRHIG